MSENKGVNEWAGRSTSKKPPKHGIKLIIFLHFNITEQQCFTMNYKSNVNETYITNVPPQHLSYTQK